MAPALFTSQEHDMKRDLITLPLDLGSELIVDNFAGGGGASTGLERAFGRPVDIAINHDAEAIAMHLANHPHTAHYCESVFDVDPAAITGNQPVGLVWLSPDCKHFSKAKGGKPVSKKIRGLAWIALRWAATVKPRVIMLENVEEFVTWGPLGADGRPCPKNRGRTFRSFVKALARHGYRVEHRELRGCDFGAPTIRKRLFLVARRDGLPIVWPTPTHGDPKSAAVRAGALQPWRTAGTDVIDWSIPCPSIFERERPLKDATLRRIARGIMKFVVNSADPFVIHLTHHGADRAASINAPLATVTGANRGETGSRGRAHHEVPREQHRKRRRHAAAYRDRRRRLRAPGWRCACHGRRCGDVDPDELRRAARPGAARTGPRQAARHRRRAGREACRGDRVSREALCGVTGTRIDVPTGTVTTTDHHAVVTSNIVKLRGTSRDGQPADEPLHTVSAGGTHHAEVRAFLIKYYGEGGQWQDARDPMHTIPTRDRMGLVTIHGEDYAIVDIGMRMLTPRELARAQGFPDSYVLDPIVNGKPLSKSAQVRMIGNSVCPDVATALIRANFSHEQQLAHVAA